MSDNDSPIVLTREGKHWLAKDTMSGVSSFGDSETEAYRMLAEALALYIDGQRASLRAASGPPSPGNGG